MCIQYTRHKYIEYVPSKPTTTSMKEKGIDKYVNLTSTMLTTTKGILEKAKPTLRTFITIKAWVYKKASQKWHQSVRFQSALFRVFMFVACKENNQGMKIVVVKIKRIVV